MDRRSGPVLAKGTGPRGRKRVAANEKESKTERKTNAKNGRSRHSMSPCVSQRDWHSVWRLPCLSRHGALPRKEFSKTKELTSRRLPVKATHPEMPSVSAGRPRLHVSRTKCDCREVRRTLEALANLREDARVPKREHSRRREENKRANDRRHTQREAGVRDRDTFHEPRKPRDDDST